MVKKNISQVIIILLFVSCASRPVLYPNNKFKKVGQEKADKDIDLCMDDAEKYVKSSKLKQSAKSGGKGAIVGGVIGTVSGLFTGDIIGSLAQGAAIGGAGGAAYGAVSPDQLRRKYVNMCLQKKHYQVVGWD